MNREFKRASGQPRQREGIVWKKSTGHYWVRVEEETVLCRITSKLRKEFVYSTADASSRGRKVDRVRRIREVDPVAVGDRVRIQNQGDGWGLVLEVLPRTNRFSRRAARKQDIEQVIAANVDQVVAVFAAARPRPAWGLLDRYLAEAEASRLPALICINKMDLAEKTEDEDKDEDEGDEENPDEGEDLAEDGEEEAAHVAIAEEIAAARALYERIGYPVVMTCATSGAGMDELAERLRGKLSVLVGKSGVGKSTLLNALDPALELRTQEVMGGRTGKGRHTTTMLEMIELACGGRVIDTPGIREMGLWNAEGRPLAELFPEFRAFLGECRYGNDCRHVDEPECAVTAAVAAGEIDEGRYESYVGLAGEE